MTDALLSDSHQATAQAQEAADLDYRKENPVPADDDVVDRGRCSIYRNFHPPLDMICLHKRTIAFERYNNPR